MSPALRGHDEEVIALSNWSLLHNIAPFFLLNPNVPSEGGSRFDTGGNI